MRLREATSDDVQFVADLHTTNWRENNRGAFSDEYLKGPVVEDRRRIWTERLTELPPNQYVVIAENDDGEAVAFACAYGAEDPQWGTFLDNIHVRTELFAQGIGKRLMADVAAWSIRHYPDCGMHLLVLESNARARRFYERLGACDAEGSLIFESPGGPVSSRRYAWTRGQLAAMAQGAG
ncbi:MAG TPA: GNAT family N-acetyltransferase [Dehalococcoidia bacterium]|nr:GNAT family N-acetyltransferase [Dehalococcoidia bacterium]